MAPHGGPASLVRLVSAGARSLVPASSFGSTAPAGNRCSWALAGWLGARSRGGGTLRCGLGGCAGQFPSGGGGRRRERGGDLSLVKHLGEAGRGSGAARCGLVGRGCVADDRLPASAGGGDERGEGDRGVASSASGGAAAGGAAAGGGGERMWPFPKGTCPDTRLPTIAMTVTIVGANVLVKYPLGDWMTAGSLVYPVAFLVTDLTNKHLGPAAAKRVVAAAFACALPLSVLACGWRVAAASGAAFLLAQHIDIAVFNLLRARAWWKAPLVSTVVSSTADTFVFVAIAFWGTGLPWAQWAVGDLAVKVAMAVAVLLPFRQVSGRISAMRGR